MAAAASHRGWLHCCSAWPQSGGGRRGLKVAEPSTRTINKTHEMWWEEKVLLILFHWRMITENQRRAQMLFTRQFLNQIHRNLFLSFKLVASGEYSEASRTLAWCRQKPDIKCTTVHGHPITFPSDSFNNKMLADDDAVHLMSWTHDPLYSTSD